MSLRYRGEGRIWVQVQEHFRYLVSNDAGKIEPMIPVIAMQVTLVDRRCPVLDYRDPGGFPFRVLTRTSTNLRPWVLMAPLGYLGLVARIKKLFFCSTQFLIGGALTSTFRLELEC